MEYACLIARVLTFFEEVILSALESSFQSRLIRELRDLFPGCMILKNDANYLQGVPDLLILWGRHWAVLECKKSAKEEEQPNQRYYVEMLNEMSFSAFIYPSNKDDVLNELCIAFGTHRKTRVSQRQ
jgi:hypothetical protein